MILLMRRLLQKLSTHKLSTGIKLSAQPRFTTASRYKSKYYTYVREPAHLIKYKEPKFVCPEEAFQEVLKSNQKVAIQGAAATPNELIEAMCKVAKCKKFTGIRTYHMHTDGQLPYSEPDFDGIIRSTSFFMGGNVRKAVAAGLADKMPIFLSEIPLVFHRGMVKPDICLIHVSPPDSHGYCTLGTSVDCVRAAMVASKYIVALINCQMPRTFGDSIVHISHIDFAVEIDRKLPSHKSKPPSKEEVQIGKHVAENIVEDGATLQMGIGSIPDAVLAALTGHKNLGIHSEMFSDGILPLVEKGCITNNMKKYHQGRTVGSFLVGSEKLYKFVDDNPSIEMLVVDYVNNNDVIKALPKMTAINTCIEVDLTGQVCSDSIGTRMYSGFGGQLDFLRGSAEAYDGKGKPILALKSMTSKGESKIVPLLKPGAGVVTTRGHVHFIVTEHGVANLFGKNLLERAQALINIAHPKHREALEKEAFKRLKRKPSRPPC
ncbi:unnamed protein product [Phyllotreta striolata]|uniref:Acetyl-CoA hydrolase n=1 Tax=Phyllotreta striolata TaxID=444603 RepID=A0A9N9U1M9_PHYSR|nr:unnamed protein product [Phyllotreta striolata]